MIGRVFCTSEHFLLLAQEVGSIEASGKEVHSTDGAQEVSKTTRESQEGIQPCNHEKEDTRIFFHVLDAAKEFQRIMIRRVNTDVFILAVSQRQRTPQKEVCMACFWHRCFIKYRFMKVKNKRMQFQVT